MSVIPGARRGFLILAAPIVAVAVGVGCAQLPVIAANGLLHPARRHVRQPPPDGCDDINFAGAGVVLRGWRCLASGDARATVIFLHGVADNRAGVRGVYRRFTSKGFNVIAYDSRAHGESDGDTCTYGYFEKDDLRRVIDVVQPSPVVLIGSSLGAAVALQEAADDARVAAIVAAEVFSDLRTIATERAPFVLSSKTIRKAFAVAEQAGRFEIDRVSPVDAAAKIRVPVLLIHGERDTDTPPDHSRRVYAALAGPKRLLLVPGAGHNQSLSQGAVWDEIDQWVSDTVSDLVSDTVSESVSDTLIGSVRRAGRTGTAATGGCSAR